MECPSPPINSDWEQQVRSGSGVGEGSSGEVTLGAYTSSTSRRSTRGTGGRRMDRGAEIGKRVGFVMDNVESVLNLQNYLPVDKCQLVYVEDPVVYPFPNNLKLYKGDTLVIEVHTHLTINSACLS
jgi:hypothetical protein